METERNNQTEETQALPVTEEPEVVQPEEETVPARMEQLIPADGEQAAEEPAEEAEESEEDPETAEKRLKRNRHIHGALRFYSTLLAVILGVLILICCARIPLVTLVEQYEAAQPQYTADQIYDLLFAQPDWELLYDMAGIEDTEFEGSDEYAAYMTEKVGSAALTSVETAAGLSGQRRYSIRLGEEEIASFTMIRIDDGESTFPRWTLGDVEVYFTRTQSVTVTTMPGYTVYINGVPLDDSYITLFVDTAAEDHLPDTLHGYRYQQLNISGLLVQPSVVVLDAQNNPVTLTKLAEPGIYTTAIDNTTPITEEESARVLAAAKAEALFSIRAISISELRQHFDPNSQAYSDINSAEAVAGKYDSYSFDESATVISDYYRYSDSLFSVHVTVRLNVTDAKGNVTPYDTSVTYFLAPNSAGNYMVTQRLTVDLQQQNTMVRLTYVQDGEVLQQEMVSTADTVLTPPAVTGADGSVATAWVNSSLVTVLELQEDGSFALAAGQALEPMTLYPVFEADGQ